MVGGAITLAGVHTSKRQLFPESGGVCGLSHRGRWASALGRRVRVLWWRLRKRPPLAQRTIFASVQWREDDDTFQAWGTVSPANPTLDDRVRIVDEQVAQLRAQNSDQHQALRHHDDALERRICEVETALHDAKQELSKLSAEHVGGRNGNGLDVAALGVFVAAAGTWLAA